MKAKAILWSYVTYKGGLQAVKIYAYLDGKKRYLNTGVSIPPEFWDEKNGTVKKAYPLAAQMNALIRKKKLEIEEKLLSSDSIEAISPKAEKKRSFIEFASLYIEEIRSGLHNIRESTMKNYIYTLKKLRGYAEHKAMPDLYFDDITVHWYFDFSNYLKDYHRCARPGISKHIKIVKKLMGEATVRGLNHNSDFKNPAFKVHKDHSSNKIYLSKEEIDRIENIDLSDRPELQSEKDRFIIGYYLMMRWSDTVAVRRSNFWEENGNKFCTYKSLKEDIETTIPVKPSVWAILERYHFNLSGSTNKQANEKIKTIAALAGIMEEVAEGPRKGPKFMFIGTHTARRSAATNLMLSGASIKTIADLGGWKRIETLKLYLRASGLDTARMAAEMEFFQ